jgi:hypothetical protein
MDLMALANPSEFATEVIILLGCGLPLGVGVFLLGAVWLVGSLRITFNGKTTMGQVTRVETSFGGEPGGKMYTPIVTFTEERERRSIEIDTGIGFSHLPRRYRVGRAVRVVYLPQQPQTARVRAFGSMWGGALLAILAGLATCGIVLTVLFSDVR